MRSSKSILVLFAVVMAVACTHQQNRPEPVPLSPEDRERLQVLRTEMAEPLREIVALIAATPNVGSTDLRRVSVCFTGDPEDPTIHAAASPNIEFPDEIVIGDGDGCVLDPPGISCECPCPE